MRSGGRGRGLLRIEAAKGRNSRACSRADDPAAKGRRFAFGRCRERAGCWGVRASVEGPAARKRSLLRAGAAKDRGRGVRFSSRDPAAEGSRFASSPGCKRVGTGSLLLIVGPAGGKIGVRFDLRFAKRVRHDREVRLSIAACPGRRAIGACPGRRTAKALVPGKLSLSERGQAARSGRSRPLRTDRGGQ